MRWSFKTVTSALCFAGLVGLNAPARAQGLPPDAPVTAATTSTVPGSPIPIFGPPPPELPASAARDALGRLTIRAVRVTSPLRIDGKLDEEIYAAILPVSDFIQIEPVAGTPATQQTEFWVLFDDENVYVAGRVHESN